MDEVDELITELERGFKEAANKLIDTLHELQEENKSLKEVLEEEKRI